MSLVVIAECRALPGHEDRLRTALESLLEPSLDEPGCLAYRLYADPNDPARMAVVEEWADRRALDAHLSTDHVRHAAAVLDAALAEPMALRRLVAVPAG
ncbi:putative quinol monooxygenase [Kitasatospora sp. NPDC090091]|uniref:putative quinol monooxygenase n=1 Tax=Kitasatospora sp. NPDC090091 TaxID=3364081 RepID=UPI00381E5094